MPEVQPVEYNKVARAVPERGMRKAVSGISGCPFSFGHTTCALYKNSRDTMPIRYDANQVLFLKNRESRDPTGIKSAD